MLESNYVAVENIVANQPKSMLVRFKISDGNQLADSHERSEETSREIGNAESLRHTVLPDIEQSQYRI